MALDLKKIIQKPLSDDQYFKEVFPKTQIVIHHTVSGDGIDGDFNTWQNSKERVATCVIIDRKGQIYQCFSSKYWGHHIGCKTGVFQKYGFSDYMTRNDKLNKSSIGIELDSWGGLVKHSDGKWYPALWDGKKYTPNLKVKAIINVVEYPEGFRGFYGFEKYTDEQINTLKDLLIYWCDYYKINKQYNHDMWDVSKNALAGNSGIWSHVSYRVDKSDVHSQIELINMLKTL